MRRVPLRYLVLLLGGLFVISLLMEGWAAPSVVQEVRIQKVGDITYFHVRLEPPKDLLQDGNRLNRSFLPDPSPTLAPRLIAPDEAVRLICQRYDRNQRNRFIPGSGEDEERFQEKDKGDVKDKGDPRPTRKDSGKDGGRADNDRPRQPVPVSGLEFVGRTKAQGAVKMKLVYPVQDKAPPAVGRVARKPPMPEWKEKEVVLDFSKANHVPIPKQGSERKEKDTPRERAERRPPVRDDLEGLWAIAQVDQFLELDQEVREFGFYGFAATATARKYGVQNQNNFPARMEGILRGERGDVNEAILVDGRIEVKTHRRGELIDQQLYETTTGAAAITESLQLRRMNAAAPRGDQTRKVPIGKLKGIDIAEHPWQTMMGDRKPAPEPFAQLVPHDNYYIHFKNIARFIEFAELIDQWGANLTRVYEVTSRDYRLKDRYEQQLCLRSTALGKTLGPLVIKGIGITGSDTYLREGSDVAIVFQVVQKKLFLAAVEPFLADARKKFGAKLKENKDNYQNVAIESFVTPLREVSLHRAILDDFVIYANSPVGVRRVLDAYQGRSKQLAQSLDYQYMRTIFRYDDKDEDGFAFLSDAFIRNLVGPASKIKERRRLEALVSLHMLTHGAMLAAWETGKPPTSQKNILQVAGLKVDELPMSGGEPAVWDAENLVARSDVYNTIHFATPLIELPIDTVTRTEADEYERFRLEYLGLWRQYFDPIGMRVALKDSKVQLDTYILPLIENTSYNALRRVTGQKTVRLDPTRISNQTLFQYMMRLSSDLNDRQGWLGGGFGGNRGGESPLPLLLTWASLDPIGEWFLVRLDDSPVLEKLFHLAERAEAGEPVDFEETAKLVWKLPVALGVDVRNPLVFAGALATLRTSVKASLPGALTWEPLEKEYQGVSIVRVQATPTGRQMMGNLFPGDRPNRKDPFLPALYYAMIDGGFYLTFNEDMMHRLIDGAVTKPDGKGVVEISSSLYLAPAAAEHASGLLTRLLEYQTHQQARTSLPIWYALYRTGIVAEDAKPEQAQLAAYRYLGFVPISPDRAGYRYEKKSDEVVNERHGSFRKPTLHRTNADNAPLRFLLDQWRSVRADLRFREDGIHTVLTIERASGKK